MTAAGIGIGLTMALASPASAHTIGLRHGTDQGGVVRHNVVAVLDKECDGHTVYLQYDVSTIGGVVRYTLYDRNGCNNSGSTRDHYPQQVTRARLCETNDGCTAWRST
jgi:hypothetical protein